MSQPTSEGTVLAQKVVIGTKLDTINLRIKNTVGQECFKCGKEGHPNIIFQKAIRTTTRKKIIEEAITKIPGLVDPVNEASLTLEG